MTERFWRGFAFLLVSAILFGGLGYFLGSLELEASTVEAADAELEFSSLRIQLYSVLVSGGILLITALGVFYVSATLRAALQANQGFMEASKTQLRAYVNISMMQVERVPSGEVDGKFQLSVKIEVTNTGQTPAIDSAGNALFHICKSGDLDNEKVTSVSSRSVIGAGNKMTMNYRFPRNFDTEQIERYSREEKTVQVKCLFFYTDVFGTHWEVSGHGYLRNVLDLVSAGTSTKNTYPLSHHLEGNSMKELADEADLRRLEPYELQNT